MTNLAHSEIPESICPTKILNECHVTDVYFGSMGVSYYKYF